MPRTLYVIGFGLVAPFSFSIARNQTTLHDPLYQLSKVLTV
jgi:hypothetical protein